LTPPLRNRYFLGMTKDDQKPAKPAHAANKKAEARAAAKSDARAAALRANLMKRKQQTRTRAGTGDAPNKKED
jgi:hypothetical protein